MSRYRVYGVFPRPESFAYELLLSLFLPSRATLLVRRANRPGRVVTAVGTPRWWRP